MDCGAYRNGEDYVVRIRGSEYSLTEADWQEFLHHLHWVGEGLSESMSEDYNSIPAYSPPATRADRPSGKALLQKLGLSKPKTLGLRRI